MSLGFYWKASTEDQRAFASMTQVHLLTSFGATGVLLAIHPDILEIKTLAIVQLRNYQITQFLGCPYHLPECNTAIVRGNPLVPICTKSRLL